MPFKFHLKKSRQYNVISKNQYVICVELLDRTSIECTLTVDSLAQECLENVVQRLGLGQSEFFGLQYVWRHGESSLRWVDKEKPLKRQLEKEAKSLNNLYLRVMYYITDVQLIQDDMTRYHYYLQLKSDVLAGKCQCNLRQATLLASYSMQAEFGNYDPTKHTPECLQQYSLFPKKILEIDNSDGIDVLFTSAICQYKNLLGVTQAVAEELYISIAMQLEGYGQETFTAKNESNNPVILGISINGILVVSPECETNSFYRWKDISNVINHRKTFRIECQNDHQEARQFSFSESKNAKYIWRLCIAQHTFYMQHQNSKSNYLDGECNDQTDQQQQPQQPQQQTEQQQENDKDNIDAEDDEQDLADDEEQEDEDDMRWTSYNDLSSSLYPAPISVSTTDLNNLRALLPSYRPAPDYETAVQMKYNNNASQREPYYANQSTIAEAEFNCLLGSPSSQFVNSPTKY